jgi:hypothetical protein
MKEEVGEDMTEMLGFCEICRALVHVEALLYARGK